MRLLSLVCLGCLLAVLLCGCAGGHIISRDQEIQMGRESGDQFERQNGGRDRDAGVNALIRQVAARITPAAQPPDYPYDVRVLKNKTVNAVAFPGGRMYLYRGLIDVFERSPDRLAWVLGHEASHISRRHSVKLIERQLGYQTVIALVLKKGDTAQIAGAVSNLMLLGYSRDEELEADRYGLVYTHAAGYDPSAAISVLRKFQELQGREPSNLEIMFATHPGDDTRINNVQSYLKSRNWGGAYYRPGG